MMSSEYLQRAIPAPGSLPRAFQEVWFAKLASREGHQALWLRFTLLVSANGFRRVAEVWAVFSQRGSQREIAKLALKRTFAIEELREDPRPTDGPVIQIDACRLALDFTRGEVVSKGRTIRWDFKMAPGSSAGPKTMNFVPEGLRRAGVVRNTAVTESEDLRFTGRAEIDGVVYEWAGAPGMIGHFSGPRSGHSWSWAHSNCFVDAEGKPQDFIFEGLSARAVLVGPLATPRLSSFYFHYRGEDYAFNSVWDSLRIQSTVTGSEWAFEAERGPLLFRGKCKADLRDLAGLTYEDTNGSFIHCASTQLGDLEIHVYRQAKPEASFYSRGTAAFEIASRVRNRYVPALI